MASSIERSESICGCLSGCWEWWRRSTSLDDAFDKARNRLGTLGVNARLHSFTRELSDDYEVSGDVLGKGFNGNVYLAMGRKTPGKFAVKSFKLNNHCTEEVKFIWRELSIYLSIDHPHIVRLVDVYRGNNSVDLVMECMQGGTVLKRVAERRRFSEKDAVEAIWQMVVALNYLHSLDIVHRDVKLENFLYESRDSTRLKLIDFGFSKIWDRCSRMRASCGTLAYVAPEVLQGSYTSQCDMWSLGVACFILLTGKLPFEGPREDQMLSIQVGAFRKPAVWEKLSPLAQEFTSKLLVVDPQLRLSPEAALKHAWLSGREAMQAEVHGVDADIVHALQDYANASTFRRTVMYAMAWSLTNKERNLLHNAFMELDTDRSGTISLGEFKELLLDKFHLGDDTVIKAFEQIDSNHSQQLEYSEFLAACASARITLHKDLFITTYRRFDEDNSGYISAERLQQVLGQEDCSLEEAKTMMMEADPNHTGQIPMEVFLKYVDTSHRLATVGNDPLHTESAGKTKSHYSGHHAKVSKLVEERLWKERQARTLRVKTGLVA